ncbi:MAG: mechanosensitive ion channel family protein [Mangrovibacterium sp.]
MEKMLTNNFWERWLQILVDWIVNQLPSVILLIILLIVSLRLVAFFINRMRDILQKRTLAHPDGPDLEAEKRLHTLMGIVRRGSFVIIWLVFIMIFLKKFNIDIAPIIAGAGIIGLAVGFGAQELVRDFISGFFILLENQIRMGDVVILNGTGGVVEDIQLRTVTLRDQSGTVHVFQNGKINTIANMTKGWSAMVFDIGVAYKENPTVVMKIMKEVSEEMRNNEEFKQKILEPMEIFGLDNFSDSALIIKGRIKTRPGDQWSIGREYRKRLKDAFDKNHIEIPFPTSTITWAEDTAPIKLKIHNKENRD